MGNKIELRGRVLSQPELRTAPGGMSLLRLVVECGADGEELRLQVLMAGDKAREACSQVRAGQQICVSGHLRPAVAAGKAGIGERSIEVLADEIRRHDG